MFLSFLKALISAIEIKLLLKAVGAIENGADGLIDSFCEYFSDGLLIIPTIHGVM